MSCAVLPTKDEDPVVVQQLASSLLSLGIKRILFIDDSAAAPKFAPVLSPEGACRAQMAVVKGPGKGLGAALKLGLGTAVRCGCGRIITMDADGQHDPSFIPGMLQKMEQEKCGVVLGVRPHKRSEMNFFRYFISELAVDVMRGPVEDSTSGFRIYSAKAAALALGARSNGYAFQVEALKLAAASGIRICVYPIRFYPRRAGKSKLTLKEMIRAAFEGLRIL